MHAYTPDVAELNLVAKSILLHDAELHGGSGAKHKPLRFLVTVVWCAVPFSYCGLPMIVDTALTDVIHEELDGTEHFVYTNESPHLYGSWARGVPVGVDVVSFSPLSPSFLSSSHLPSLLVSPPLSSRLVSALLNSSLLPSSPLLSSLIISPLLSSLLLSLSSLISSPLSSSLLSPACMWFAIATAAIKLRLIELACGCSTVCGAGGHEVRAPRYRRHSDAE